MNSTPSDETSGDVELPIAGRSVSVVGISRFAPLLRLHFWPSGDPDREYTLQIDGPLRIVSTTREWMIDPEAGPDPAYLLLVDKTVSRAIASHDGSLHVEFTDGDRMRVPPDQYEPWQLSGDDGTLIVSVAGGGLSIWSPTTGGPARSR